MSEQFSGDVQISTTKAPRGVSTLQTIIFRGDTASILADAKGHGAEMTFSDKEGLQRIYLNADQGRLHMPIPGVDLNPEKGSGAIPDSA